MTAQTHPWRFVDAATGKTVQEWTATTGEQMISVNKDEPSSLPEQGRPGPSMLLAGGFDGLGGAEASYCPATVSSTMHCPRRTGTLIERMPAMHEKLCMPHEQAPCKPQLRRSLG